MILSQRIAEKNYQLFITAKTKTRFCKNTVEISRVGNLWCPLPYHSMPEQTCRDCNTAFKLPLFHF